MPDRRRMVIGSLDDVTNDALGAMQQTVDPRLREIMVSLVKHLHSFVREVRLTEPEFRDAATILNEMGKLSSDSHNEPVLMAGSLGVSSLVCLLNNGDGGNTETSQSLLGPFWRLNSPRVANGGTIIRSETPGDPLIVTARVVDRSGAPIAGAEVDVWHASPIGLYENQDPEQAEMNLRGKFTTDANGEFSFRSIKPAGYPIPTNGPVGALLNAQKRHNFRPAHLHFLIYKPGFKTVTSQIYSPDDPHLDTDSQFGVTRALVGHYEIHEHEPAPVPETAGVWYSLQHTFILQEGKSW